MSYAARITKLEASAIHGYYGENDSSLWHQCEELAMDSRAPKTIRIRAMQVVNRIVGQSDSQDLDAELLRYVRDTREMLGSDFVIAHPYCWEALK